MGRGGFVIIIPPDENGRRRGIVAEGVQPPEVVAKFRPELKTYIGQLELLWAASPIASYPHLFANRRVIHFIDNSGAVGALIKGYATHPRRLRAYSQCVPRHGHLPEMQRLLCPHVRSHRNVSDPPSREAPREAFDILERAGLKRLRISYNDSPFVPSLTDWTDPADVWADRVRSETARR